MDTVENILRKRLGIDALSRILVVGLGKTGYSVAKFLFANNIKFALTDSQEKPLFYQHLIDEMPSVPLFLGGFSRHVFVSYTHLIVSPGIALTDPNISNAIANGVSVLGDIDLFVCAIQAPIVAITGSNGKSTVTSLLGQMANEDGINVAVGGNLGTPALDLINENIKLYVVELSSFQLERSSLLNANVATVLNVSADHMDRYYDMNSYAKQKRKVYFGSGIKVINIDDVWVNSMREQHRSELSFSVEQDADFHLIKNEQGLFFAHRKKQLLPVQKMLLQGQHNIANALAALALGSAIGLAEKTMCATLEKFKGLAHRMQKVAQINGVTWINDSKATNASACIAAMLGCTQNIVLIAGGDCKKNDMFELISVIEDKVKVLILIGKDAELIARNVSKAIPAYIVKSINDAVNIAAKLAKKEETVLLSPACSSLDQFKDYQDRGNQFMQAVQGL